MTQPDWSRVRDHEEERPYRTTDVGGPLSRSYWTARGVVPRWQLLLVYVLIAAIGIVGFIRIGNQASNAEEIGRENHHLVVVTNQLARQSADLARQLQAQRVEGIRRSCDDQNRRHDRTLHKLDVILRAALADKKARATVRAQNVILIDALAPKQNCDEVVRLATRTP